MFIYNVNEAKNDIKREQDHGCRQNVITGVWGGVKIKNRTQSHFIRVPRRCDSPLLLHWVTAWQSAILLLVVVLGITAVLFK